MPDDALDMIRRNVQFMKKAAPRVSPATLMDLIMENAGEIFDTPDNDVASAFEAVIKKGEKRDAAMGPLLAMSTDEKKKMYAELWNLGWNPDYDNPAASFGQGINQWGMWCSRQPREAVTLYNNERESRNGGGSEKNAGSDQISRSPKRHRFQDHWPAAGEGA